MEKSETAVRHSDAAPLSNSDEGAHCPAVVREEVVLSLVDHLDAMLAYWDVNQLCVFANNAYQDWFGKTREQIVGITLSELLGPLYLKNLPYIQAAYAGQKQIFERDIATPDGRLRHSLATYTPHVVGGKVAGIFVHVADVTLLKRLEHDLKAAKAKAEVLATHDFLTGLPNRALLQARIAQALADPQRQHNMLAVLSVDLDDFKKINDTCGHSDGDRMLVETASRMKGALREVDTIARFGGDEFIALIPEIDSELQVEVVAARLLAAVGRPLDLGTKTIVPSCSIGIALYPAHGTTPEQLLLNSDRALYAAKHQGKNRFALFSNTAS